MAVLKLICNTLNKNSNNSNIQKSSPQLTKCKKMTFSMSNYLEHDVVEIQFSNVNSEQKKPSQDLPGEFVLIDIKKSPVLTILNVEFALSRPYITPTHCGRRIRTLTLPTKAFTEDQYWGSFMQSMSEIGIHCLKHNLLLKDDFIEQEPFLYIGLPSIAIFDMLHRSCTMKSYPIVFPNGTTLDSLHCPINGPIPFKLMEIFKARFVQLKLTVKEISWIKIKLLYSSGEREFPDALQSRIERDRLTLLNAFVADVISASIDLTQFAHFKDNFEASVTKQILKAKL